MKNFFCTICFFLFAWNAAGQEFKTLKWIIRPSAGATFPLTTLKGGYITDPLIDFSGNTFYWQFISSSWFFSNWGIEFSFMGNLPRKPINRHNRFVTAVENRFGKDYYATTTSGAMYAFHSMAGGSIEKGGIGPVYKMESGRFVFMGRALIGVTSFYSDYASARLKAKDSNEILQLNWSTDDGAAKDFLTFNPSVSLGCRLSKRFILNFDVNYWLYNIRIDYSETMRNPWTGFTQTQDFSYSSLINEFSLGAGFMIVLK
jgi:hypothetical protein